MKKMTKMEKFVFFKSIHFLPCIQGMWGSSLSHLLQLIGRNTEAFTGQLKDKDLSKHLTGTDCICMLDSNLQVGTRLRFKSSHTNTHILQTNSVVPGSVLKQLWVAPQGAQSL